MKSKKETSAPVERHMFTPEELQRMENYLELQTTRKEIIGLLDKHSCSFADWSIIISEAVHDAMEKKQQLNMDCEKERKMLDNLSYLFTKLAYHSGMLSEWHKQLSFSVEQTGTSIEQGHP